MINTQISENAKTTDFFACKVVERANLQSNQEQMVVNEIYNHDLIDSLYVVKLRKAIKTDSRYFMIMEYCNGGNLAELMELKKYDVDPRVINLIMKQLITGLNDMLKILMVHRDIKLQNIMIDFPENGEQLLAMSKSEKMKFLKEVDLLNTKFVIKIADFGYAKKLSKLEEMNTTHCGTYLYMAPQVIDNQKYSYKADIWSVGVILFELLTSVSPFHAKTKLELEKKINKGNYTIKDSPKKILTIECLSFLVNCLQFNEADRKSHMELVKHPYIMVSYDDQKKINSLNINQIVNGLSSPLKAKESKKNYNATIALDARNSNQAKSIEFAINNETEYTVSMDPSFRISTRKSEQDLTMKSFNTYNKTQMSEEEKFDSSMQIEDMLNDHSDFDQQYCQTEQKSRQTTRPQYKTMDLINNQRRTTQLVVTKQQSEPIQSLGLKNQSQSPNSVNTHDQLTMDMTEITRMTPDLSSRQTQKNKQILKAKSSPRRKNRRNFFSFLCCNQADSLTIDEELTLNHRESRRKSTKKIKK